MKVAILTTDNREYLKDYGNPAPHFGTAVEALFQGLSLECEAEVHVISCAQKQLVSPAKLAHNIWFHTLFVPKFGWMRTAYHGCIRAVRRKLREIQPDVVHGQGTERDCAISAVFSGFPNVLTIHGNMRQIARLDGAKPFAFGWLAARLEQFTVPRSDGVVCITTHTQREVRDLAKRTWLAPNAVDQTFFELGSQPQSPHTILCVGRICLLKNTNRLIRALDGLQPEHKFNLIFLGHADRSTPYGAEFHDLISERSWCQYHGVASRSELKERLKSARLLVLPSLEDNCPMVVLEAMAAGVPVVAAKVGGVPDLIQHGETGWLCDPNDPVSMRNAVQSALSEPQAAEKLARNARQKALERYHPTVVARRHLEIYREVLSRKNSFKPRINTD